MEKELNIIINDGKVVTKIPRGYLQHADDNQKFVNARRGQVLKRYVRRKIGLAQTVNLKFF